MCEEPSAKQTSRRTADGDRRLEAAGRFIYANARPIDRAIFEHLQGAPAERVLTALEAHRNADGGFGRALEPDVRGPHSQPIHTLTALELLREAGIRSSEVADDCCRFLDGVTADGAAVPALLPGALDYPAAGHWQGAFAFEPSLFWTFGLVTQLTWHGAGHPWAERARKTCLDAVEGTSSSEAHHLLYLMRFTGEVVAEDQRQRLLERWYSALADAAMYVPETPVRRYGLTPLHYAPAPDAPARRFFGDHLIESHLGALLDAQQVDGGWPIRFDPPSEAARLEWRGRWTLEALAVLHAYERL